MTLLSIVASLSNPQLAPSCIPPYQAPDSLKSRFNTPYPLSSPRPPQAQAASFKRPYRKCPRYLCAVPIFSREGTSDRVLTFLGPYGNAMLEFLS